MSETIHNLRKLKALLFKDEKYGGYTAYFQGYPQAVAEGESIDEALDNLKSVFVYMVRDKLSIPEGAIPSITPTNSDEYLTKEVAVWA